MSLEDDVSLFTAWAAKLGCPLNLIPNEESQKSIFRAKRSKVFHNLISKVRPLKEVENIRHNILLAKVKINPQTEPTKEILAISSKQLQPVELQRFNKIKKNAEKIQDVGHRIKIYKSQFEDVARVVKIKNIEKLKLKQELADIQTKHAIFESKDYSLKNMLDREQEVRQKLDDVMPVKPTANNKNQNEQANKAINECMKLLDEFNQMFVTTTDSHSINDAKAHLWEKFRQLLSNIPDTVLWNVLVDMKDRQLENIKRDSMETSRDKQNCPTRDNEFLELAISQLSTKHIIRVIQINAAIQQNEKVRNEYVPVHEHFTEVLQAKIGFLSDSAVDTDDVDDFIVQFATQAHHQGQISYLESEIGKLKCKLGVSKPADLNNSLIAQLSDIYQEINAIFNRMQDELNQLYQIKDKINYSKSVMNYLAQEFRPTGSNQTNTNLSRTVCGGGSSFNMNTSVCSSSTRIGTMSDLDGTLRFVNNPIVPLPAYAAELIALNGLPVAKLRRASVEEIAKCNPLVTLLCDDTTTLQVMPSHLLTIKGALQEIKKTLQWDVEIRKHMKDVQIDFDVFEVNKSKLKRLNIENSETITELLDQIDVITINSKHTIANIQKYYDFLVTNPLRNYVPLSKLFNGCTYREYEAEYMLYYRILRGAQSR